MQACGLRFSLSQRSSASRQGSSCLPGHLTVAERPVRGYPAIVVAELAAHPGNTGQLRSTGRAHGSLGFWRGGVVDLVNPADGRLSSTQNVRMARAYGKCRSYVYSLFSACPGDAE
jgi:hypothetical protein